MSRTLNLDLIENPYGKRIGGGYSTILVGGGEEGRVHIDKDGDPLCMQGKALYDVRPSKARVVTCYRCIKIMGMESNAPYLRRELTTARGQKKGHIMIPGGRQGQLVADKKQSPFGMEGASPFKRGPAAHPTQGWMTRRIAMAKTYPERLYDEGIALPVGYKAPRFADEADISEYTSPKAKRRGARESRQASLEAARVRELAEKEAILEAALAEQAERRAGYANNPYRRNGKTEAAEAMRLYHSGQAASLKEAWAMVRGDAPRRANGRR